MIIHGGMQSCPWGCPNAGETGGQIVKRGYPPEIELEIGMASVGGMEELKRFKRLSESLKKPAERNWLTYLRNLVLPRKPALSTSIEIEDRTSSNGIWYVPLSGLLPHLIGAHCFFEGVETPYRADPLFLISAFGL